MRSALLFAVIGVMGFWSWDTPLVFSQTTTDGRWQCHLKCPGGDLRFGIVIERKTPDSAKAFVTNGDERIAIPELEIGAQKIEFRFTHYDSVISCERQGQQLVGTWRKRRGQQEWVEMSFVGQRPAENVKDHDGQEAAKFVGRWAVDFGKSDDPAVGIFSRNADQSLGGTFLTTTGDYRFLHGYAVDGKMVLSCFDGAHAFLFEAKRLPDGELKGDFWSSNTWHESWTARRQKDAALPDAFKQTKWVQGRGIDSFRFPDLNGRMTGLADPKFAAPAKLVYVFGSWCPNCHDAAAYFAELKQKYSADQLSIVGLAFELTGDFERDAKQVKRYLARHGVDYPVLIAGMADKKLASKSIPFLDKVRSYPTTIFLDSNNNVQAIHTGFTGPATGDAFEQLKKKFETRIDSMILQAESR